MIDDLKRAIDNCESSIAEAKFEPSDNTLAQWVSRIEKTLETAVSAIQELQQYKDTGLTPSQIRKIDELYLERCRELAEYKKLEDAERLIEPEGPQEPEWKKRMLRTFLGSRGGAE